MTSPLNPAADAPRLRLPDRAGALQDAKDWDGLAAELGDNYDRYHEFLAQELARVGGQPSPPQDFGSMEDYLVKMAYAQKIVWTESFLRTCRSKRQAGSTLRAAPDNPTPLVNGDRLLSINDDPAPPPASSWAPMPAPPLDRTG